MRRRDFIGGMASCAAWSLAAHAQQPAMPVIGFLSGQSPIEFSSFTEAFRRGLHEAGFSEEQNVQIEYRWADGHYDRLPALADELVKRGVAVIAATGGTVSARAAKAATTTIPIVFTTGADPIQSGLVSSLNRSDRNLTGISFFSNPLAAKRMELLRELVPKVSLVALLVNPNAPNAQVSIPDAEAAARSLSLELLVVKAGTERELAEAFLTAVERRADGLLVDADAYYISRPASLVGLAAHYNIPTIYFSNEFAEVGGLISYGTSQTEVYRQAGMYVGRILRGEKPGDLPVLMPTKYVLVINMNAAKGLGLTVPLTLQVAADFVIE
jgi:putative tryptophan/tyrosine transport system substrate-binding protein